MLRMIDKIELWCYFELNKIKRLKILAGKGLSISHNFFNER
jgi:hypothetical protein